MNKCTVCGCEEFEKQDNEWFCIECEQQLEF